MKTPLLIYVDRGPVAHDKCGDCQFRMIFDQGDDNAQEYCINPTWGPHQPIIDGKRIAQCIDAEVMGDIAIRAGHGVVG